MHKNSIFYHTAGWSSLVARWAHNPKVGGSNPPPAIIGPVVQVVRMPACHAGGRGFKSRPGRLYGSIAQSVEQRTENPCVGGSIPSRATILFCSNSGGVAKWPNAADCKSAPLRVRQFESAPLHCTQGYSLMVKRRSPKPLMWVRFLLPLPL